MQTNLQKLLPPLLAGALLLSSQLHALEIPRRAEDFVDSIGLNLHIDSAGSEYNEAVVAGLGVRHVRSNLKPGVMQTTHDRLGRLFSNYGTRVNLVCDTTEFTPAQYRDLLRHEMFESIEGLNEPDVVGPRTFGGFSDNWGSQSYPATIAFQQELAAALLADPATASKALLSPAMANPARSRYLRGIAADFISMHSYPGQEMPTGGFLTSFVIPSAQLMSATSPAQRLIATETGYRSGPAGGDISLAAAAKYVPRIYAEYFRLGVMRTFLFELTDTSSTYNFGLLDASYAPKPACGPLKHLISLVSESSWKPAERAWSTPAPFDPGLLDYAITGGTSDIHHVLLQKSNGTVYLLLWNEVPSYDLAARRDLANAPVPVDVTFAAPVDRAALYRLGSAAPAATYGSVSRIRIDVPDEVVVLELTPGTVTAPAGLAPGLPTVAVGAAISKASARTGQDGRFVLARSGSTAEALTVSYAFSGTAVSGLDFAALPTSVQIPAGASEIALDVHPLNLALVGRKSLVLTLDASESYGFASSRTATVYFGEARTTVADFESSIAGWVGNAGATTAWSPSEADASAGALRATFTVNGTDRWINNFQANFASPQDWSAVSTLELRIKESPSNPLSDIGQPVYFAWHNDGVGVGGGYGVGKIPLDHNPAYRTLSIDLHDFPRDRVTALVFYVDGAALVPGQHTLFLDNLTAVTSTNGVIDDFEDSAGANWNSGARSSLATERSRPDTGAQALAWTYQDDGGTRWDNHIKLDFPQALDLSAYSTLAFRFREDPGNPASDAGARVFVDWFNRGARANGDNGVTSFALRSAGGYRTIEVNLSQFGRDRVNALFLYVDGDSLSTGRHAWYIDNVLVY